MPDRSSLANCTNMKQTRFIGTDANVVSQSDSDGFENAEKAMGPRRQFDMTTILLVHAGIATDASFAMRNTIPRLPNLPSLREVGFDLARHG